MNAAATAANRASAIRAARIVRLTPAVGYTPGFSVTDACHQAIRLNRAALLRVAAEAPLPVVVRLTPRELQVIACICQGDTDGEAAERLFVSPKTIQFHLAHIYVKLHARNRAHAAVLAVRADLV